MPVRAKRGVRFHSWAACFLEWAEIDTEPYNEVSLKFHEAMGFQEVGTQYVRDGKIKVSLQAAKL